MLIFSPYFNITQLQGIIYENHVYICTSTSRDIFLGVLYGYKMFLQVVALILAFSIRKVKVKGLDDSKYVAAAIYVTSLVLAVIIVCTFTLQSFINVFAALFFSGFFAGTTVILVLVFVPLVSSVPQYDCDFIIGGGGRDVRGGGGGGGDGGGGGGGGGGG